MLRELQNLMQRKGEETPNFSNHSLKQMSTSGTGKKGIKSIEVIEEENQEVIKSQNKRPELSRLSLDPPTDRPQGDSYRISERISQFSLQHGGKLTILRDLEELKFVVRKIASDTIYPMKEILEYKASKTQRVKLNLYSSVQKNEVFIQAVDHLSRIDEFFGKEFDETIKGKLEPLRLRVKQHETKVERNNEVIQKKQGELGQMLERRAMARADMESRLIQRTEFIAIYESIENYYHKYRQKFRNYEGVFKRNIESRLKSVERRKEIMTNKLTMKRLEATSDGFMQNLKACEVACKAKIEELEATMSQLDDRIYNVRVKMQNLTDCEIEGVCKYNRLNYSMIKDTIESIFGQCGREIEFSSLIEQKQLGMEEKENLRSQYQAYQDQIVEEILEKENIMFDDEDCESELQNTLKELKFYYEGKIEQLDAWLANVESLIIENSQIHLDKGIDFIESNQNFMDGKNNGINFMEDSKLIAVDITEQVFWDSFENQGSFEEEKILALQPLVTSIVSCLNEYKYLTKMKNKRFFELKLQGELLSLKKNFLRVCVSLYNIFSKEIDILIRKLRSSLSENFEIEKETNHEIDNIFKSIGFSEEKREELTTFVELLYKLMRTDKLIKENENMADNEIIPQVSLLEADLEESKEHLDRLKQKRTKLMEEEEVIATQIGDLNFKRKKGIRIELIEIFPEYEEAKVILNDGVIARLVKSSLKLFGNIDRENQVIIDYTKELTSLLDQLSKLEEDITYFRERVETRNEQNLEAFDHIKSFIDMNGRVIGIQKEASLLTKKLKRDLSSSILADIESQLGELIDIKSDCYRQKVIDMIVKMERVIEEYSIPEEDQGVAEGQGSPRTTIMAEIAKRESNMNMSNWGQDTSKLKISGSNFRVTHKSQVNNENQIPMEYERREQSRETEEPPDSVRTQFLLEKTQKTDCYLDEELEEDGYATETQTDFNNFLSDSQRSMNPKTMRAFQIVENLLEEVHVYFKEQKRKSRYMKFSPYLMERMTPEDCGYMPSKLYYNPLEKQLVVLRYNGKAKSCPLDNLNKIILSHEAKAKLKKMQKERTQHIGDPDFLFEFAVSIKNPRSRLDFLVKGSLVFKEIRGILEFMIKRKKDVKGLSRYLMSGV